MNEILNLLLLELRSFYGINKFLHTNDTKVKKRYFTLGFVWLFLICMIFVYIGSLSSMLCSIGLGEIIPAYLASISSFFIVFFGMFGIGYRIFRQKGYDILASMPLKPSSIVISRFLGHYIADLVLTLVISLPGIAVYSHFEKPGLIFYIFTLLGFVFVPAIPLAAATLLGSTVMAISSRLKNKSAVQSLLSVLVVLSVTLGSFSMGKLTDGISTEQLTNLANAVSEAIKSVYPPALWLNSALISSDFLSLALFILVSAAIMTVTVALVSKNFDSIVRRLSNHNAKHNYKKVNAQSRSIIKSLYLREAKRYFSSSIYVTNTILGPIMGAAIAIALCVVGIDSIKSAFPFEIDIASIVPIVFAAPFCMMPPSTVSISMEGKQINILKSLPIPSKALFDGKILLNLSLMLPFYIISEVMLIIAIKPDFAELLWMLLIPALIALLDVILGIAINLKFHSFDWEREEYVVKQSLPSALGGFAGVLMSLIIGLAVFLIPKAFSDIIKVLICLILIIAAVLIYKSNNKADLKSL